MPLDISIIGAGPAGSATAIRLAQAGLKIRLYEKARFPRAKLCGGFLSPESLVDIEQMGVLDRIQEAGALPVRRTVVSSPSGRTAEAPLPQTGLSLSREALDMILLQRAREAGVDVREGTDGFSQVSKEEWTIVATGRAPHPRSLSPRERDGVRGDVGIQAFFDDVHGISDQVELDLIPGGYVGFVRQTGRVNICALSVQDAVRDNGPDLDRVLAAWTRTNPVLAQRLREARRVSPWQAVGPVHMGVRRLTEPNRLFTGDAACVVDPFAGEGIAMGVRSAALVQRAFEQNQEPVETVYARLWHQEFDAALRWGGRLRNLMRHPWLQNALVAGLEIFPPALTWLAEQTRPKIYAN